MSATAPTHGYNTMNYDLIDGMHFGGVFEKKVRRPSKNNFPGSLNLIATAHLKILDWIKFCGGEESSNLDIVLHF